MRRNIISWCHGLVVASSLLLVPVYGCGEILADVAEQRHLYKATRTHVYEAEPDAIWTGAESVLDEHGFKLEGERKLGLTVKAAGAELPDKRTWVDVRLTKVSGGHRLELIRQNARRVEDVRWEADKIEPDPARMAGVEKRLADVASRDGTRLVIAAPKYRVWAEVRQEMIDAGVEVSSAEAPTGVHETPWIVGGESRSRRRIKVEELGNERFSVHIESESQTRHVEQRWDQGVDFEMRDGELEFAVIERVEPNRAAKVRTDAAAKAQRAGKVGEQIDRAVEDAVEEAVEQEREKP